MAEINTHVSITNIEPINDLLNLLSAHYEELPQPIQAKLEEIANIDTESNE